MVTHSFVRQGNGIFVDVAVSYADFERARAVSSTLKPVFEQSSDRSGALNTNIPKANKSIKDAE
ncbi:hypothetical protein OAM69_02825 [bacterium]|nr:hypothetical protein [bacterium]